MICNITDLADSDNTMASLFALSRVSAFGSGQSNELAAQREVLKQMRDCARPASSSAIADCLRGRYEQRNNDLAIAALMRAPDVALPVLRRTDPAFAPVFEAVSIWAAEPAGANWADPALNGKRQRITALLTPLMANLLSTDSGRTMLSDPETGAQTVKGVDDIFVSENRFAMFLNVLGPFMPEDDGPVTSGKSRRSLSCAAIIRHPALLAATASAFGSTLDNFVLDTDCAQTLPPMPQLAALDAKLNHAWPQCEGTIRFAAYRIYATALDAARLGMAPRDENARAPSRRGVTPADIAAARRELAASYQANLGKPPATAAAMAADAINGILASAQECE
ncbi:hypothetical protein Y88_2295 [Novosphingobium nitrogenifigens DSM 19370]|uniref:Uncharacterized protein n=2 Tax=Novosphingobium nitrogenifigens TaxID=378548 RepID=F1Z674_9SPHN|nr:hypothetical protein Y88_2295 [Novosphingobium nitrogenifigens DSM 19370]